MLVRCVDQTRELFRVGFRPVVRVIVCSCNHGLQPCIRRCALGCPLTFQAHLDLQVEAAS